MYASISALVNLFLMSVVPFWPLQAIIAGGFLFSMYFTYVQAFVLRAFCTWCVVSALNFTVMAYVVFVR